MRLAVTMNIGLNIDPPPGVCGGPGRLDRFREEQAKAGSRLKVSPFPESKSILDVAAVLWSLWTAADLWASWGKRRAFSPACP
jgi:hypothetical protein